MVPSCGRSPDLPDRKTSSATRSGADIGQWAEGGHQRGRGPDVSVRLAMAGPSSFYYHLSLEYQLAISREGPSFSNPNSICCVLMGTDEENNCISGHNWTPDTRSSVIILSAPTHWVHPRHLPAIFTSAQSEWKLTIVTNQMT